MCVRAMKFAVLIVLETTVAARIAGEDIVSGDFVAVISEIIEFPSFVWNCAALVLCGRK